jgi:hypothetical protein
MKSGKAKYEDLKLHVNVIEIHIARGQQGKQLVVPAERSGLTSRLWHVEVPC